MQDETSSPAASWSDREQLVGTIVAGKYYLERYIGNGSTGAVYRARHSVLDKAVALKILDADLARNAEVVELFKREAKAASRIDHANSVRILDFGESASGLLYIVMEYVEGPDLLQVLDEEFPLPELRVIDIMSQLLQALAAAHELGVVHRDIKPENLLVLNRTDDEGARADLIKVCDFGIAQLSTAAALRPMDDRHSAPLPIVIDVATLVGTPEYMSPEQVRGEPLDARCDIYGAGVTLFQLLTGRLPFSAPMPAAVAMMQCATPTPRPSWFASVDPRLEAICMKAMSKEPANRYPSARHMRFALRNLARLQRAESATTGEWPVVVDPGAENPDTLDPPVARAALERPRRRSLASALAVLLLLPAMAAVVYLWPQQASRTTGPQPDSHVRSPATGEALSRLPTQVAVVPLVRRTTALQAPMTTAPTPPLDEVRLPRRAVEKRRNAAPVAMVEAVTGASRRLPAEPSTGDARADALSAQDLAKAVLQDERSVERQARTSAPDSRAPRVAARAGVQMRPRDLAVVARIQDVAVRGSLAKSVVQRAIERLKRPLSACYMRSAQAAGRHALAPIRVEVELDERGRARRSRTSGAALPGLDRCVNAVAAKLATAQPPDTGIVNASWHVTFER